MKTSSAQTVSIISQMFTQEIIKGHICYIDHLPLGLYFMKRHPGPLLNPRPVFHSVRSLVFTDSRSLHVSVPPALLRTVHTRRAIEVKVVVFSLLSRRKKTHVWSIHGGFVCEGTQCGMCTYRRCLKNEYAP